VTTTLTPPEASYGVVAVIVLLLMTLMLEAVVPPKLMFAPETKLLPLIVTDVPPVLVPLFGVIDVIEGAPCPGVPER
jgi:hypothetical protein